MVYVVFRTAARHYVDICIVCRLSIDTRGHRAVRTYKSDASWAARARHDRVGNGAFCCICIVAYADFRVTDARHSDTIRCDVSGHLAPYSWWSHIHDGCSMERAEACVFGLKKLGVRRAFSLRGSSCTTAVQVGAVGRVIGWFVMHPRCLRAYTWVMY